MNVVPLIKAGVKALPKLIAANAPTILTITATGGVIATARAAAKAAPIASEAAADIREMTYEEPKDKAVDIASRVVKPYLPAIAWGALTVGCIWGAHVTHVKKTAALAAALGLAEQSLSEYRREMDGLIDDAGRTKLADIEDKRINKELPGLDMSSIEGTGDTLFKDSQTGRYFKSTLADVHRAEAYVAKKLIEERKACVNDFYWALDLDDDSTLGDMIGWRNQPDAIPYDIHFEPYSTEANGDEVLCWKVMYDYEVMDPKEFRDRHIRVYVSR